jgi:hypothetical protein
LCSALFILGLGSTAFAQAEPAESETSTSAAAEAAPEAPAEEAPAADSEEAEDEAASGSPPKGPAPTAAAVANDTETIIGVQLLPGSEPPQSKVRGITGGSLWLTQQGYQWPYMPKVAGRSNMMLGLSGSVWVDGSYVSINSDTDSEGDSTSFVGQGRGVLRATPAYSTETGWFAQAQIELVGQSDQFLPTNNYVGSLDDLWVRAGKWGVFDITVGRFQGWELYHFGMALDQNTVERRGAEPRMLPRPPQFYGADYFWDRQTEQKNGYAVHVYPTDILRFEVLGVLGATGQTNQYAARGTGILDLGIVKAKVTGEFGTTSPQIKAEDESQEDKTKVSQKGIGAAVQVVVNPHIEAGLSVAISAQDSKTAQGNDDLGRSNRNRTFGGFVNGRVLGPLIVGAGAHFTRFHNQEKNGRLDPPDPRFGYHNYYYNMVAFGAVQYSWWDRMFLKLVVSHANYEFEDNIQLIPQPFTYKSWSGRVRAMFLF